MRYSEGSYSTLNLVTPVVVGKSSFSIEPGRSLDLGETLHCNPDQFIPVDGPNRLLQQLAMLAGLSAARSAGEARTTTGARRTMSHHKSSNSPDNLRCTDLCWLRPASACSHEVLVCGPCQRFQSQLSQDSDFKQMTCPSAQRLPRPRRA